MLRFRGIELLFQRQPGVVCTAAGYTYGQLVRPSYRAVLTGSTGHTEAVQVVYDPAVTTYVDLVRTFMAHLGGSMHTKNQVGNDRGSQYRHGIYPHTPVQRAEAEAYISELQAAKLRRIVTEVVDAQVFWPAEEYHQVCRAGRGAEDA